MLSAQGASQVHILEPYTELPLMGLGSLKLLPGSVGCVVVEPASARRGPAPMLGRWQGQSLTAAAVNDTSAMDGSMRPHRSKPSSP